MPTGRSVVHDGCLDRIATIDLCCVDLLRLSETTWETSSSMPCYNGTPVAVVVVSPPQIRLFRPPFFPFPFPLTLLTDSSRPPLPTPSPSLPDPHPFTRLQLPHVSPFVLPCPSLNSTLLPDSFSKRVMQFPLPSHQHFLLLLWGVFLPLLARALLSLVISRVPLSLRYPLLASIRLTWNGPHPERVVSAQLTGVESVSGVPVRVSGV